MKKVILNALAIGTIAIGTIACKGDKNNQTTATKTQEVVTEVEALKFKVDKKISVIEWTGFKPGAAHKGTLRLDSGVVRVGGGISGNFVIDMNSLTVTDLKPGEGKEGLEGHLKGTAIEKEDHFFNVAKFPTAAFEITGVSEEDGKKMMQGNLTIRDVKKNIEFPVIYNVLGENVLLKSEVFTINRTDWGINYGSKSIFNDLGDKFIMDDIELQIVLRGVRE